ncbi:hypothetical protein F3J44_15130 [Pantoea sp. Tr-811]|uniref:hypothetical protein n=1 Tax=Pantoea sp. Tr-811 TaxID=2608361 RepID=UPI00142135B2|nr:hypothetical protein [Pantoea sp. Tr-811]NIF27702.1 hypothetical protein [Pantoea sp. Tr-811]
MGLFSSGKKAAKFAFITMPMAALGLNQLRMGNQHIKALWRSNFNPACPECERGILLRGEDDYQSFEQSAGGKVRELHSWTCNNCDFALLEEDDLKKVRDHATHYRNERVKAQLTTIERQEVDRIARNHQLHSRAFFIASLIAVIGFVYLLATGAGVMIALNWLSIAFALWVFGMKKSYRSWQVKTGQLFVQGAFWFWFQHQKWII